MRTAVECVNSSQVRYYIGDGDTKDVTFECQFLLGKVLQCVKEDIMNNKMRTAESVNSSQVRYYDDKRVMRTVSRKKYQLLSVSIPLR